jgi:hypothetical protein
MKIERPFKKWIFAFFQAATYDFLQALSSRKVASSLRIRITAKMAIESSAVSSNGLISSRSASAVHGSGWQQIGVAAEQKSDYTDHFRSTFY